MAHVVIMGAGIGGMPVADAWEARYRQSETGWDRGEVSPALLHWLDTGMLAPCRVLIPGCGHGYEAVRLAEAGFDVLAIDIAPSAVAYLQKSLAEKDLHADVIQGDVLHFETEKRVDAIYEQTCLCALEPGVWPDYERKLSGWLKPGGRLFALFMQTGEKGGPPFHCELDDMRALFNDERWQWMDDGNPLHISHPSGRFEWGYALLRREAGHD